MKSSAYWKSMLVGVPLVFSAMIGINWLKKELRHSEYMKYVLPFADKQLEQMSISDRAALSYDGYSEVHLAACHVNAELLKTAEGHKNEPFSDDECIEMMERSRPYAKKLKVQLIGQSAKDLYPQHSNTHLIQRSTASGDASFHFPKNSHEFLNDIKSSITSLTGSASVKTIDLGDSSLMELSNSDKSVSISITESKNTKLVDGVSIEFGDPRSELAKKCFEVVMKKLVQAEGVDWIKVYSDVFSKTFDDNYKGFKAIRDGLILPQIPHTVASLNVNAVGSFGIQFNRNSVKISDEEAY